MKDLPRIYCDMDGVLCDFKALAEQIVGMSMQQWINEPGHKYKTIKEKWAPIINYPNFWQKLPWMAGGSFLWSYISKYKPHLLSAFVEQTFDPHCIPGKKQWAMSHLSIPVNRINLVRRKDKKNYAKVNGKPAILIDDYIKNVTEFTAKGGIGILHTSAANTINQLKKLGFK